MQYKEEMNYIEKVALEGEIALQLSQCIHDEEVYFKTYQIIMAVTKKYREIAIQCLREITTIPQDTFDRILLEVSTNSLPVWLWHDKCIADLKACLVIGETTGLVKQAISKVDIKKKILSSAFNMFCRKASLISVRATLKLCSKILQDEKLDFLYPSCLILIDDLKELLKSKKEKKINPKILNMQIDVKDILNYQMEKVAFEENKALTDEEMADKVVQFLQTLTESSDNIYLVKKTFKSSNASSTLQAFDTEEEAELYIQQIKEQFPELARTCTFNIQKQKRKK